MDKTNIKQRFHVVQLAMFNAEVLNLVQQEADANVDGVCRQIIDQSASINISAAPPSPSTVNQSLFFGVAYLALVWLSESLSDKEVKKVLSSDKMKGVWEASKSNGPRDLTDDMKKLKLVRNALSHGKVEIDDHFVFTFWDQNKWDEKEDKPTTLSMGSHDLGKICTKFYYAASEVIYP